MSHVYFTEVRISDSDDYNDLPELPVKQPPRLTRKQAQAAWKIERDMAFFNALMRESTSYRSYKIDDLRNRAAAHRNYLEWSESIEADRAQREYAFERMAQDAEHRNQNAVYEMENASRDSTTAERRQQES